MAFKDTAGTAVIDAVLTDIGRKRMADGTFRPVKFALGDDEIDYSLIGPDAFSTDGAQISLSGSSMFEAYGSEAKNIQYGLNTFDTPNSLYRPILKLNDKVSVAAQLSGSTKRATQLYTQWGEHDPDTATTDIGRTGGTAAGAEAYYLAANDETADKMREIFTGSAAGGAPVNSKFFKFLEDRNFEGNKIVVESGLDNIPIEEEMSIDFAEIPEFVDALGTWVELFFKLPVAINYDNRIKYLVKRNYLDRHYFIMADNRFIEKILGPSRNCSSFKNFADGTADINFQTTVENTPITYFNQFDDYYTFVIDGVPNLMFDHEMYSYPSTKFSNLLGPKGTATAINFAIIKKLKADSSAERDYRYTKYGVTDQKLFDATHKFDYIETVIYIVGATTDSRIQAPVRIIRYSGT